MPLAGMTIKASAAARASLEDAMRGIDGVIAPRFGAGTEHLLLIAFNADKTRPADLLAAVRQSGHQAQLVGL
ncbi:hypothetical protein [Lamprocystis purpurea]|jgi:hypothetical protein|uniref:hypothetical protein n=1 Tax=Lamprocystis purpurea TaxID=61598 RepID=UPI0003676367|nr:hypothetical protein [Lamprocystis purpurea]